MIDVSRWRNTYVFVVAMYVMTSVFGTPDAVFRVLAVLNLCYCYWRLDRAATAADAQDGPSRP